MSAVLGERVPLPQPAGARRRRMPRAVRSLRPVASPRRPPAPVGAAASVASTAFLMIALVCVWTALQMLVLGGVAQTRAQTLLYDEFRAQVASGTAPLGPVVPVGEPVALLSVPRLGIEQVVVEGTASGDTLDGPGHRRDTPLPGQVGTSVVYGRAATYGAPFASLPELVEGDALKVVTAQGRITFRVLGVRRAGEPLPPPSDAGTARLTLVTAEGDGRLAALSPSTVVYVDAEAPRRAFPAPPGRPAAVPEPESAMASDPGALPLLALCLALLLATTLGVVAARQRWSTALVWVVTCPLVLALSWLCTDVVMRLLPNLV